MLNVVLELLESQPASTFGDKLCEDKSKLVVKRNVSECVFSISADSAAWSRVSTLWTETLTAPS